MSWIASINAFLANLSKPTLILLAFLVMLIISMIDILTGSELSFSLFYLAPILALTWYTSTKIGIFTAVAGSLM